MLKKISLVMLCWIAVAFFVACSSVQSNNQKTTEVQIGSVNNQINDPVIPDANADLKAARVQPTSLKDRATSLMLKGCQPSKVPLSAGLPDNANINERLCCINEYSFNFHPLLGGNFVTVRHSQVGHPV